MNQQQQLPLTSSSSLVAADQQPLRVEFLPLSASTTPPQLRGSTTTTAATTNVFIWKYSMGLTLCLGTWVLYLVLPRGVRRAYFRAHRRRHARETAVQSNKTKNLHRVPSVDDSVLQGVEAYRRREQQQQEEDVPRQQLLQELYQARREQRTSPPRDRYAPAANSQNKGMDTATAATSIPTRAFEDSPFRSTTTSTKRSDSFKQTRYTLPEEEEEEEADWLTSSSLSFTPQQHQPSAPYIRSNKRIPSPQHPALHRIPDDSILQETMRRLGTRGMRLWAHGVQCAPKKVWIRLVDLEMQNDDDDDDTTDLEASSGAGTLEWRTEFPRQVTNQSGQVSTVLMRGAPHTIALPNILYVDVGKKTAALRKATTVAPALCFSLLTQTGSLDLQTHSQLERDALVACWSQILDKVHPQHDWRRLYEQSPVPSAAVSNISSSAFPVPTAAEI